MAGTSHHENFFLHAIVAMAGYTHKRSFRRLLTGAHSHLLNHHYSARRMDAGRFQCSGMKQTGNSGSQLLVAAHYPESTRDGRGERVVHLTSKGPGQRFNRLSDSWAQPPQFLRKSGISTSTLQERRRALDTARMKSEIVLLAPQCDFIV